MKKNKGAYAYPKEVGFESWVVKGPSIYFRDLKGKKWGPYKNPYWVPPKDFNPTRRYN